MSRRLTPRDPDYPALLTSASVVPDLYMEGALHADDALAVAIVGSRAATAYGTDTAERLAAELAARGVTIVSGLARGIDAAAHRGALGAGGRTLAVLGNGIDVVYPPENRDLAREIVQHGALLSQFAPGTPPLAWHFPARNRVIAALVLGVVVVEAAERSGALITARLAADLGREVFAVPGRITSPLSAGPHELIQDGAKLVRNWTDVVQELPEHWRRAVRDVATLPDDARVVPVDDEAVRVLAQLSPDEPHHIEDIIARRDGDAAGVAAALVALELGGWARQLAGQRWVATGVRVRRA
jgi:DNA processing protein